MTKLVRIATRKSPLALWQARHVAELLERAHPGLETELLELSTRGDKILDQSLANIGGKDLFVKEIEQALLEGRAEIAVHSLKDVPTLLPDGLVLGAFPTREDPRDAIVSTRGHRFDDLPHRARVGTCSLRRAAQFLRRRDDLEIVPIRGNVQTRLRKLDEEAMHATVLANAGLVRLGLGSLATEVLDPSVCLPAIGQGILAVEVRMDDEAVFDLVRALDHGATRAAATAERAFLHRLEGGCQVPIAGHATVKDGVMHMRGLVASLDGQRVVENEMRGSASTSAELGRALADLLLDAGAGELTAALRGGNVR